MTCRCSRSERRWTDDGQCAACQGTITEAQLTPVLLQLLCGGTGLVLWRNTTGYDDERKIRYGVGGPGGGDFIGLHRGRYIEVELKTARGIQRPEQRERQALIERLGGIYALIRCERDARALLERLSNA
jgi:hypothetical protein